MTQQEGILVIKQIIEKLNKDSFAISLDNFNQINFDDIGKDLGHFWLEDKYKYNIILNKKLLTPDKYNYLVTVAFHELAHSIQYTEAFNANIIEYDRSTDTINSITENNTLAFNTIFSDAGHTKLWLDIVKELNKKYNINPPVKAFLTAAEIDLFLEEIFMKDPVLSTKNLHVDTTVSGLTLDDMMNHSIKSDYKLDDINELLTENVQDSTVDHVYRDFSKYAEED